MTSALPPDDAGLLAILDAIGCGALVLNAEGHVLQTNAKARRYLGSYLDISRRGRSLGEPRKPRRETAAEAALREALRASAQVTPLLGDYIIVPRPGARPLLMRSFRLPGEMQDPMQTTAALIVLDMEDAPQPDEALLRDVFLMTPAEIRLARLLSRGENVSEISEALGVSAGTLRVQLKMLFMKTGTRRQAELVALLAHLTRLNG